MQSDTSRMENNDAEIAKKTLIELFEFGIYKLDRNLCTPEEIRSIERMVENNLELLGSISDIAKFYGVSEQNVRTTINRRLIAKPVRKVLYPFHLFRKIVPEKWRKKFTNS